MAYSRMKKLTMTLMMTLTMMLAAKLTRMLEEGLVVMQHTQQADEFQAY